MFTARFYREHLCRRQDEEERKSRAMEEGDLDSGLENGSDNSPLISILRLPALFVNFVLHNRSISNSLSAIMACIP
jgi:hypothetical protein